MPVQYFYPGRWHAVALVVVQAPRALVWGTLSFFLSFVPVVGTTPDWAKKDRDGASTPGNPDSFGRFLTDDERREFAEGLRGALVANRTADFSGV